jgi:Na+-translocating ferredoxin:NAD+ oxidoreductase RnfG subunit
VPGLSIENQRGSTTVLNQNRPHHINPQRVGNPSPGACGKRHIQAGISVILALLLYCVVLQPPATVNAEVFHSRESALRLAFPGADDVVKREIFLDSEEKTDVERRARVELQSRLITVYVGLKGQSVVGYAFIETHKVRSLPETILVVIEPDGRARAVHLLAFHEPQEYAPSDGWLEQFEGRPLNDELSLRGDVDGISGATMTANSITASVRRILAVFEVAVKTEESGQASTEASGEFATDLQDDQE